MKTARITLLLFLLLSLSTAVQATVTGAYRATIASVYELSFTPTAPGRVRVHAELRPLELFASLQLYRPGEAQPIAVITGHSSVDLLAEADEASLGRPWRIVLANSNNVTLNVEIDINFPKALLPVRWADISMRSSPVSASPKLSPVR